MDWSQAGNMPVSSAENQSINGDLYETMLIFKIQRQLMLQHMVLLVVQVVIQIVIMILLVLFLWGLLLGVKQVIMI